MSLLIALQDLSGVLTSSTWVPLGSAVLCVGSLVLGYKWLRDQFDASRERDAKLATTLDELCGRLESLERARRYRWTVEDQRIWELEFQQLNPTLRMPDAMKVLLRRAPAATSGDDE